jgi:hypothetical protein
LSEGRKIDKKAGSEPHCEIRAFVLIPVNEAARRRLIVLARVDRIFD